MDRVVPYVLSAVLLAGIGAAVVECNDVVSVCGNGVVEKGEQCDNGMGNGTPTNGCSSTCQLVSIQRATLNVMYQRVGVTVSTYPNFPAPTCKDLGISQVHLVLDGPAPQDVMNDCSAGPFAFSPIEPGTYTATITMIDANGAAVSKPVKSAAVDVQLGDTKTIDIVFQTSDYLRTDYVGNLDFLAAWGTAGTACANASPAVLQQSLFLTRPGETTPVAMMTKDGMKLDGTAAACFNKSGSAQYQEVMSLPWGYYDLTITGKDATMMKYCKKFPVFVGIGVATPTYDLVVDPVSMDDGGVACP